MVGAEMASLRGGGGGSSKRDPANPNHGAHTLRSENEAVNTRTDRGMPKLDVVRPGGHRAVWLAPGDPDGVTSGSRLAGARLAPKRNG